MARTLSSLGRHGVGELTGVGEKRRKALASMEIESVLDLLTHYPRRYVDRTVKGSIAEAVEGEDLTVEVTVRHVNSRRMRNGRTMVTVNLGDDTDTLQAVFFNQPWRAKQLQPGMVAMVSGKVAFYRGQLQLTNPLVDLIGRQTGRIVAIYPQSEKAGVTSIELEKLIDEALKRTGEVAESLDSEHREAENLIPLTDALRNVHFPQSIAAAMQARERLAFDELLRLQLLLALRKERLKGRNLGIRHQTQGEFLEEFYARVPFALTGAQERAIKEISGDLESPEPMHRLLQGDVGSGKTLVAVAAFLMAAQGGHQSALLAPTEVLAEQHFRSVSEVLREVGGKEDTTSLFGTRPLRVELLTARTTASTRRSLLAALHAGEVDVLIGTHALLNGAVQFGSLGLVVVDEQHRFGVEQRAVLRDRGAGEHVPDVLVMTATPIPRTAAMTVYGDLEVTTLDEMPPGRTPVTTRWAKTATDLKRVWKLLRDEVSKGRQAYVVCPLVDESEKLEVASAVAEYERLQSSELKGLNVGLLHGQMKSAEKDTVMQAFREGELDVLVATTVIEVGVDVPNATVMVIEDADRFGLAQLHQLRGRVGRGAKKSFCYLLTGMGVVRGSAGSGGVKQREADERQKATERMKAMVEISDGFELAEVDLEQRGSGSILGARQKGMSDLKIASLKRAHRGLITRARRVAQAIAASDPWLQKHPVLQADLEAMLDPDEREFLFRS